MSLISTVLLVILLICLALGLWTVKRINQPKSKREVNQQQLRMQHQLTEKKADLTPWKLYSYRDIVSAMLYKYEPGDTNRLEGMLFALDKKPIVAFERSEEGFRSKGFLSAHTSEVDLFYELRPNEFVIEYNNELLGRIEKTGTIYDHKEEVIGNAIHPPKISFDIAGYKHRAGENFYKLYLNNRILAHIWIPPNYSDEEAPRTLEKIFEDNIWGLPILEMIDKPSKEEEKWLLAMAVFEVAYHAHWLD